MRSRATTRPWPGPKASLERRPSEIELIYDWNDENPDQPRTPQKPVRLHDETLRDGLQGPSTRQPPIGSKLEVVHLLDQLGVFSVDTGLPSASPTAYEHCLRMCQEIADTGLSIRPTCAGRTIESDIQPMVDISQATGRPVEVMTFIGVSHIRQFTEGWSAHLILRRSITAIDFAVRHGLPVTFVTEDTTRSHPALLRQLVSAAVEHGATRLCVCDTVGYSNPAGVTHIFSFLRSLLAELGSDALLDWHGHNDRGLALANALVAREQGADRLHGCVLGIGERVGNTALDLLLINLQLLGVLPAQDLSSLRTLAEIVAESTGHTVPANYPVLGEDAFKTATGVHAAAIVKARRKGSDWLANRVYSSVPAELVGRKQEVRVGPMSGASNVSSWLEQHQLSAHSPLVEAILGVAKRSDHDLTDQELMAIVDRQRKQTVPQDPWDERRLAGVGSSNTGT